MRNKNKLPTSVVVLNIIMIIIVIVICFLLISLLYGDQFKSNQNNSSDISISDTSDNSDSGEGAPTSTSATTTTKASSSVSMTKRSTEPTSSAEPTEATDDPQEPNSDDAPQESDDLSYSKQFFENDLFIGDSITTGLHLFSRLNMKNVAADKGLTPYKAYTDEIPMYDGSSMTAVDYAEKMQPKRIFIMLGSNGLAAAGAMEDSYKTLINKLNAVCPDSVVYCISVTPLAKGSMYESPTGINNDKVKEFNNFIKSVCSENGIRYIDFYSQIIGSDGYFMPEYAEVDGMHFKSVTYDKMLHYIQKTIS
ncbi:MAG: GDSL-type esterase/lipase family protein [Oscillospiraceae bacterium]